MRITESSGDRELSEYEYLECCIFDDYFERGEELDREWKEMYQSAVRRGDIQRMACIEYLKGQELMVEHARRTRRMDLVRWLKLDTELRAEGTTYPDIQELPFLKSNSPLDSW